MDPNKSLFNNLTTQVADTAKKTVKVTTEEAGKFSDQATKQVAPQQATEQDKQNTKQEVEGIYGGKEAVMDPTTYKKKAEADRKQTSGLIEQIMGQLLPNHKMHDDRKEKMAMEHKQEAENLGLSQNNNQKQQEEQRKQQEEEEEKRKKEAKKANLETPIEAPQGKTTGMSFGRKKSAPRMQAPPSAETRGGKGNRE